MGASIIVLVQTMAIVKGMEELDKDRPDLLLSDVAPVCLVPLDVSGKVSILAVLHDDEHLRVLALDKAVDVGDDVLVAELLERVDLVDEELLLLLAHLGVVDFLAREDPPVRPGLDLVDLPEGAASDDVEEDILLSHIPRISAFAGSTLL